MTRKKIELNHDTVIKLLQGSKCPNNCGGKFQLFETPGENKIILSCYQCGMRVDFEGKNIAYLDFKGKER